MRPGPTTRCLTLGLLLIALVLPASARNVARKKQMARSQFDVAERMREELTGRPAAERSRRDYQRVTDAYRRVYYTAPTSSKADTAVVAVAELLAEAGRQFSDPKSLQAAIGQYEFLRREYPGSKYRFDALFTIGQIYKDDLNDAAQAKTTFQEFLRRYPHHHVADAARRAIAELEQPPEKKKKETEARKEQKPDSPLPLVTGVRHWSTPDYTRVAIDLEAEVQYEAGRIANPDRIFFDLHDTKLASVLVGKSFDVADGFLRKIRVAQYQRGLTRVVLEVDDVSDYAAFLLPNPYRLIVDIHGKQQRNTVLAKKEAPREEPPAPARPERAEAPLKSPSAPAAAAAKPVTSAAATDMSRPQRPANSSKEAGSSSDPCCRPERSEGPLAAAKTVAPKGSYRATRTADGTTSPLKYDTVNDRAPHAARSEGSAVSAVPNKKPDIAPELAAKTSDEKAAKPDVATTTVAKLEAPELKATTKPTSAPTFESVAPRVEAGGKTGKTTVRGKRRQTSASIHAAEPSSNGERSLIRALGLKIGKIVVDAGHGGHDTGTIGPNGLQEKDLVLDVALRLGKLLESKLGADVVYTRDDDTFIPLETRTAVANQNRADLFISIHANSSNDPSARGVETYYLNFTSSADALEVAARENAVSEKSIHELQDLVKKIALKEKIEESREFAADVQRSLYGGIAAKTPAVRNRGVKKAPFIVLIGANMPSVLAEISFLSNPSDERRLQTPEYRQKLADYLYRGIAKYVGGLSGVKVAKTVTPDTAR